ncbi:MULTISPECIES: FitA-like ribbon-helix-helix domain-containing protein [Deferrisoma]
MAQVVVRNLDERVVRALKVRASLHGKALEQELREILTRASELGPEERVALADRIRAMASRPSADSVELIREDRDSR